MVAFVVDNSIAVAWACPRQATEYTEKLLELSGAGTLHTSFIWPAEFANAANALVNRGVLTEALGDEMLKLAAHFGLMVDRGPADPRRLYVLSRQYCLSAYDASYLELAMRLNLPLATRDAALKGAAEKMNLFLA